jgi:hypothetical protein
LKGRFQAIQDGRFVAIELDKSSVVSDPEKEAPVALGSRCGVIRSMPLQALVIS